MTSYRQQVLPIYSNMEISQPKHKEPTPEEIKELDKLKAIIELAICYGKLTGASSSPKNFLSKLFNS